MGHRTTDNCGCNKAIESCDKCRPTACQCNQTVEADVSFEDRVLALLERIAVALEQANWIRAFPPAPPTPVIPYTPPQPYTQPWEGPYTIPVPSYPYVPGTTPAPYVVTWENTCKVDFG
jgi:hypothetical protein